MKFFYKVYSGKISEGKIIFENKEHFSKGWYLLKGQVILSCDICHCKLLLFYENWIKTLKLPVTKRGIINFIFPVKEKPVRIEISFCKENKEVKIVTPLTLKRINTFERILRMYRRILPVFFDRNLPNKELLKYLKIDLATALKRPVLTYYKITHTRLKRVCKEFSYQDWIRLYDRLSDSEKEKLKNLAKKLKSGITFLLPVKKSKNISDISNTIQSLKNQLHQKWELFVLYENEQIEKVLPEDEKIKVYSINNCNENFLSQAKYELVGIVFPGDELSEKAALAVCKYFEETDADVIYTDSDFKNNNERYNPLFKPDWNKEYFLGYDYIKNLVVFKKDILIKSGGFRFFLNSYVVYDAILRILKYTEKIYHIPWILYHHAKEKPAEDWDFGLMSLKEFLQNKANVKKGEYNQTFRIHYQSFKLEPFVSIVIPTKDRYDLIKKCIDSILNKTSYKNYEIVIVDNGTKEEKALQYLKELKTHNKIQTIRMEIPFNFSKLVNAGVEKAKGDVIVLLNNDVEVISESWLKDLVCYVIRKDVGVVGAKLLYPDGKIQHAGVIIGIWGVADHAFKGVERNNPGYMLRIELPQEYSAVTAACMAFRKHLFYEVNGFDEKNFPVLFNDTDFCLKVKEKGYKIIYTPYAVLYHHEHATIGKKSNVKPLEAENFRKKWKKYIIHDPFYNPNLSLYRTDFALWHPRKFLW